MWGVAKSMRSALLIVGVGLIILPGTAGAASWSIQSTPNGAGAEHSSLFDMSCEPLTTAACTAVGQQTISGKTAPYAQYWNGSTWVNQSAEAPAGATAAELQADHCLSKTSCVAAGSYTTAGGTFSLVEVWNGTSWTVQATPNPTEVAETRLKGISCKAITACFAVGYSLKEKGKENTKSAVVMRGNSGVWSLQSMPKPSGAVAFEVNGIDCPSTTLCLAVGAYEESSGAKWAMAAKWNGAEWIQQGIVPVEGSKQSILLDVACSDIKNCTAVGGYRNSSNVQGTYVLSWDGSVWTRQISPNPAGSTNSVLQNVSCADRYDCIAVGDWLNAGVWQPMALSRNSTFTWSLDTAANPASSSFGVLEGVACRVTCISVGWYTEAGENKTLAEVRSISTWTQREIPSPTIQNTVSGISCSFTVTCVAVGMSSSTARAYMGATIWEEMASPAIPGSTSSQLRDVSCVPGVTFCMAGGVDTLVAEQPYAAKWAGSGWTTYKLPLPAGSGNAAINDVSCTSSTACTAVGDYKKESTSFSYAARWNGSSWSVQSVPKVGTSFNILNSVSCVGKICVAVGYNGVQPLVVRWNGTSWSSESYFLPLGGTSGELYGVSCSSESFCMTVGRYQDGVGGRHPQWGLWKGSGWIPQQAPRPAFAEAQFEDVSCTSSTACFVVGKYEGAGPLTVEWNGTIWTVQDTGLTSGTLLGVSCTSSTTCRAAGERINNNLAMTFP
jgi:hypothetical protein